MEVALIALATSGAAIWAIVTAIRDPHRRQMRRLREAKIWPIGELPDGTIGRIVGTVRPVGPALIAPLTGRECVWYHIYVNAVSETANDSTWQSESISFLLEDRSGRALV